MNNSIDLRRQQYQRFKQLFDLAVQRRSELQAEGDTKRRSGCRGDDYLTEEERQEFFALGRLLAEVQVIEGRTYVRGKPQQVAGKLH